MDNIFLLIIFLSYFGSMFRWGRAGKSPLLLIALILHFLYLSYRTILTGHAPFSGAFESLTFFSFLLGLKTLLSDKDSALHRSLRTGTIVLVLLMLLAALLFPARFKTGTYLLPALKSLFFLVHVPVFFMGYAYLASSFILMLVIIGKKLEDPSADRMVLHETRIGYILISIGILTGSIWAYICWGSFWAWDSKENWALITWLVYTVALHSNSIKRSYFRVAVITGFAVVLFTYLGVMFLLPGLHSYM